MVNDKRGTYGANPDGTLIGAMGSRVGKLCGDIQNLDSEVQAQLILKAFVDSVLRAATTLNIERSTFDSVLVGAVLAAIAPHVDDVVADDK